MSDDLLSAIKATGVSDVVAEHLVKIRDDVEGAYRGELERHRARVAELEKEREFAKARYTVALDERDAYEAERDAARGEFEFLRNGYTMFGGRGCPACVYEDGKFIRNCKLHECISAVSENVEELTIELERCKAAQDRRPLSIVSLEACRDRAERSTAEAIASWIERSALLGVANHHVSNLVDAIRAGAFRPTPTRGDSDE